MFYIYLYLSPKTGQINSVSSSFCTKFFMMIICESASVTIEAYIFFFYIYISFKMNIGELLTDTSMFIWNRQSWERDRLDFLSVLYHETVRVFLSLALCTFQVSLKKSRHGPLYFLSPFHLLPHPPASHPWLAAPQKVMSWNSRSACHSGTHTG